MLRVLVASLRGTATMGALSAPRPLFPLGVQPQRIGRGECGHENSQSAVVDPLFL